MGDKKYYWLKLKEDFFEEDTLAWLEEQTNGKEYCLFYLKLCLKSLKTNGILIRNVGQILIPYDVKKLGEITKTDIDTVTVAMELFKKIGLIQILDNGEIYITQLEQMVGSETKWAKYKKKERELKKLDNVQLLSNINPKNVHTEIEKEIEKEKDIEKDIEIEVSTTKVALIPKHLECIVIAWNNLNLSTIKSIQNTRLKLLNARIKDYGIDGVLQAINNIKESSFLKGQNNKNWTITFDWLIKPSNFIKVLEGNYTDKEDGSNARNIKKDNRTSEKPKYDFSCF